MNLSFIQNKLKRHNASILGHEHFSKYAVLLPLIEREDDIHILFEVRSQLLRRQPGEICFPGGRIDNQDKSPMEAAVRETTEELGIHNEEIKSVYPIDYLVSPFGMIVYPFVGIIRNVTSIQYNKKEVEEIFTVPLSFFLQTNPKTFKIHSKLIPEENFPFELIKGGEKYNWRARSIDELFYFYEDKVIWGLTARILHHFLELTME
ncbi:NUDIX hydrolase [Bacillus salitolerans]|uniref:NUDIX hydrolase n=1 Tax=Bacillus salitolerans TaxID=1437434 RepID=A0ABW4LRB3_9BACI